MASTNRSVGSRPELNPKGINPAAFLSSAPHFLARGPAGKDACSLKVKIILITVDTALLYRISQISYFNRYGVPRFPDFTDFSEQERSNRWVCASPLCY